MRILGIKIKKKKWSEKLLDIGFSELRFPILYYDINFHYPPFKILENRNVNYYVFESFEDLISNSHKYSFIKTFVRLIDSSGLEYHTEYSKELKINVPVENLQLISLEEIKEKLKPSINKLDDNFKEKLMLENSISGLFILLNELEED